MKLFKSFDSSLGQYMCKITHPSGGVESSNPCQWRGERLHHHGGYVCCVFVFSVVLSSGCLYSSYVERYTFSLTIGLIGITCCPTLAYTISNGINFINSLSFGTKKYHSLVKHDPPKKIAMNNINFPHSIANKCTKLMHSWQKRFCPIHNGRTW